MAQLRSDSNKRNLRPSMTEISDDTGAKELARSADVTRVAQRDRLKVAGAIALPLRHDSSKSIRASTDDAERQSLGGDELLSAITKARRSLRPSVAPMSGAGRGAGRASAFPGRGGATGRGRGSHDMASSNAEFVPDEDV